MAATAIGPMPTAAAAVPVVVIDGKGWGHGVGMAQDGAFWMAKAGASTGDILGHFYPGTKVATSGGTVRVAVLQAQGPDATLAFPNGGEVRDAPTGQQSPGFPIKVGNGGQVRVHFDGARYVVVGGQPTGTAMGAAQLISAVHQIIPAATTTTTPSPFPTLPGPTPTTTAPPAPQPTTPSSTPSTTARSNPSTTAPPNPGTSPTTAPPSPGGTTPPPGGSPPGQNGGTPPPDQNGGSPGSTQPPPPPPPGSPASARPLWAVPNGDNGTTTVVDRARTYRGMIQAVAAGNVLRLVDQLDVETYLKGMGEVRDPSWPLPALQSQAIAARTYALRAMASGGEICDDERCQVYLGAQAEYAAMNKAVDTTAHQVLAFGNALASTVYSANAGGFSASREEGFGPSANGDYPYLQPAPYTTGDPMPWTVKVAAADLATRFGYQGTITAVSIPQAGPSGRAITVQLDGAGGSKQVAGIAFAAGLGLRSTLFTVRIEDEDAAPPPPAAAQLIQQPPEDAASVVGPADDSVPAPDLAIEPPRGTAVAPGHVRQASSAGARVVLKLFALLLLGALGGALSPWGRRFITRIIP